MNHTIFLESKVRGTSPKFRVTRSGEEIPCSTEVISNPSLEITQSTMSFLKVSDVFYRVAVSDRM